MQSTVSEIQLFKALKKKLGEKEAEELVSFVMHNIEEKFEKETEELVTIGDLKTELASLKLDLIKWVVALFITLSLMIIGLYFK